MSVSSDSDSSNNRSNNSSTDDNNCFYKETEMFVFCLDKRETKIDQHPTVFMRSLTHVWNLAAVQGNEIPIDLG